MCLIIFKEKNKEFDYSKFETVWNRNSDGAGLSIRRENHIEIIKGIDTLEKLYSILDKNGGFKNYEVALHFRYTTSGVTNKGMTHPFPISSNNSDLLSLNIKTSEALIHNGVMFSPKFQEKFSDTAIFTKWISLFKPDQKRIKEVLKENRLLIMNLKENIFLGEWHNIDGLKYSNTYSLEPSFNDSFYELYDFETECPCCGGEAELIGLNTKTYECLNCTSVFNDYDTLNQNENNSDSYDEINAAILENEFLKIVK